MHSSEVRNCLLSMFENHMFYWGPALNTQVSCETFCKKHKWFMLISRSALYETAVHVGKMHPVEHKGTPDGTVVSRSRALADVPLNMPQRCVGATFD